MTRTYRNTGYRLLRRKANGYTYRSTQWADPLRDTFDVDAMLLDVDAGQQIDSWSQLQRWHATERDTD